MRKTLDKPVDFKAIDGGMAKRASWDRAPMSLAGQPTEYQLLKGRAGGQVLHGPKTPLVVRSREAKLLDVLWYLVLVLFAIALGVAILFAIAPVEARAAEAEVLVAGCHYPSGVAAVSMEARVTDGTDFLDCTDLPGPAMAAPGAIVCEAKPKGSRWPRIAVILLESSAETAVACVQSYPGTTTQASVTKVEWKVRKKAAPE